MRFYQTNLTLRTVQRDIYLLLEGGCAFLGKGKGLFDPEDLSFTSEKTPFLLKTEGISYEGKGVFGYSVNLTPDRYYKVVLTPLVGYQALFEKLKRKDPSPSLFAGDLGDTSFTRTLTASSKNLWTKWMGPFLGGNIWIEPGGPFSLKVDYAFHFIQLKQSTFQKEHIKQFAAGGALTSFEEVTLRSSTKKNGGHGHSGGVILSYLFSPSWHFSLEGKTFYFSSHVQPVGIKKESRFFTPLGGPTEQNYKSRYKATHLMFSGLFSITKIF